MTSRTPIGAIFEALKGTWRLKRTLNSTLSGFPSGTFEGTATFSPRKSIASSVTAELLYAEQGELKTDAGLTLKANRKYIYRYTSDEDKISAWFVKEDTKSQAGAEEVDYLFHDLEMENFGDVWAGRGEHLCELDMYWAYYEFRLKAVAEEGGEMDVFGVRYKVKGPQKDYTSDTAYERVADHGVTGDLTLDPRNMASLRSDTPKFLTVACLGREDFACRTLWTHLDPYKKTLRLVCRALDREVMANDRSAIFRKMYVRAPVPDKDETALRTIAPLCYDLTIIVGEGPRSNRHDKGSEAGQHGNGLLDAVRILRMNSAYVGPRTHWKQTPEEVGSEALQATSSSSSTTERQTMLDGRKHQWTSMLSTFTHLRSLTLRTHGDAGWPGRTEIEDTLVILRIAIEDAQLRHLKTLTLSPIHGMGIIHLCWTGCGVFGRVSRAPSVWHPLQELVLHIMSPVTREEEEPSVMFRKILYNYLRSFSMTLRALKLVWLGAEGPSPVLLHLEPGLEGREPLQWAKLQELWMGNVMLPHQTAEMVGSLIPSLETLKMLRSTHKHAECAELSDSSAWLSVAFGSESLRSVTASNRASSIYSQATRLDGDMAGGVSRTSRNILVYKDFESR